MPNTPRLALPYPADGKANDVAGDIQALGTRLDAILWTGSQGTMSERPAAGKAGRHYYATDAGATFYDDGNAWKQISPTIFYTRPVQHLVVGQQDFVFLAINHGIANLNRRILHAEVYQRGQGEYILPMTIARIDNTAVYYRYQYLAEVAGGNPVCIANITFTSENSGFYS